ncbi:zinc knuckle CX2CX4HX4C containing protein [Tanacetum coccineum]|uniref:Zinc knuckle CX2CX4HX4C containing protein n=1 Tax=Tanacetum coccineum TaxID=301880 RepID=A0ABQ5JAZ3_9ASTR
MEAGFLLGNKSSKAKLNKNDIGDSNMKAAPLLSNLARKVRNIKGKDGKPLQPIRSVVHPMVAETMDTTRAEQIGGCNDVVAVNLSESAVTKSASDLVNYNIGFDSPNMENVGSDLIGSPSNTNTGLNVGNLGKTSQQFSKSAVALPKDAIDEINARFVNTLYGFPVGKRLAFPMVENYVKHAWAKFGLKRVMMHHGSFMFQFESQTGMEKVLESGPWRILLVPLILKVWMPNTLIQKESVSKVPLWVKMHNMPILAYSKVGLDLILAKVGRLMRLDAHTNFICLNSWGRSEYARALVEVSAELPLIESVDIDIPLEDGKGYTTVSIRIEYEWLPLRCGTCKNFNHLESVCPKKSMVGLAKISGMQADVKKDKRPVQATCNMNKGKQVIIMLLVTWSLDTTKKPSPSYSSKNGKSTYINDDISFDELRNFIDQTTKKESVLEYIGNNDIDGCISREKQDDKISNKKHSSSMEVLNEDFDSDVDEVFVPVDGIPFPSSSVGGGQPLEDEMLNSYDGYEDQFKEYPSSYQEFCNQFDFKVKGRGRN